MHIGIRTGIASVTGVSAAVVVSNPVPTLTALSPASTTAGSNNKTITASGTGFGTYTVLYSGATALATTYLGGVLTAVIPSSLLTAVASLSVTAVNPTPGGGTSAAKTFSVTTNPVPVLSSVTPTPIATGSGDTAVVLHGGTTFVPATVARAGATTLATTYVSSNTVNATVPAALLAANTALPLTAVNPTPGGGTSATRYVLVWTSGLPTILLTNAFSVVNLDNNYWDHLFYPNPGFDVDYPNVGTTDLLVSMGGTNFTSAAVLYLNGTTPLATTYVSPTQLTFIMPVSYFTGEVYYDATVVVPGVGASNVRQIHSTAF